MRCPLKIFNLAAGAQKTATKILLAEDEQSPDRAYLFTQCLQPGDAEEIISAIRQVVSTHQ